MEIRERTIRRERRLRVIFVIGLMLLGLVILFIVKGLLVSFLLAFVVTYLMNPWVVTFERMGIHRTVAILIPFVLVGVGLSAGISFLTPLIVEQFNSLVANAPKYIHGLKELIGQSEAKLNTFVKIYQFNISDRVSDYLYTEVNATLIHLPSVATTLITTLILAPFISFFLLRDGRRLSRMFLSLVPNNLFEMALILTHQVNEQLGGFIRARLLEGAIVGFVVWLGLAFMDFPYGVFLAIFAGVTNLIPYIGPIIGAVPAFLVAFINKDPQITLVLLGAVYFVAQLIDMLFIIPLVVARIVDLHPVTVVIAIVVGSEVLGILGMIISIPIASILKLTFNTFYARLVEFRIS